MKYELRDIPEGLPPGKHPTRIGKIEHDENDGIVIPVTYAPWKRIEDAAIPFIVHTPQCRSDNPTHQPTECKCHRERLPQEYPITKEGRFS